MKKFLKYLKMGYNLVKKAEEAGVSKDVMKAIEDKHINIKEAFLIMYKVCGVLGVNLDTKGLDLNKIFK